MVSTLPGPHDYRSAAIAPALDHVGAGVLEECQPIRVECRGLDHLLVGTPHWITSPLWFLPASGLPEGPTQSRGKYGNAVPGRHRPYLPTRGDAGHFFFFLFGPVFSPFTVFHDSAKSGSRPYRLSGSKTPWVQGPASSPRCFGSNMSWENGPAKTTTPTIDFASRFPPGTL